MQSQATDSQRHGCDAVLAAAPTGLQTHREHNRFYKSTICWLAGGSTSKPADTRRTATFCIDQQYNVVLAAAPADLARQNGERQQNIGALD
jgi:hypothetical protein